MWNLNKYRVQFDDMRLCEMWRNSFIDFEQWNLFSRQGRGGGVFSEIELFDMIAILKFEIHSFIEINRQKKCLKIQLKFEANSEVIYHCRHYSILYIEPLAYVCIYWMNEWLNGELLTCTCSLVSIWIILMITNERNRSWIWMCHLAFTCPIRKHFSRILVLAIAVDIVFYFWENECDQNVKWFPLLFILSSFPFCFRSEQRFHANRLTLDTEDQKSVHQFVWILASHPVCDAIRSYTIFLVFCSSSSFLFPRRICLYLCTLCIISIQLIC